MARKDISDLQVLQACVDFRAAPRGAPVKFANEILAERTGQCLKVCDRAMERAERRGLIECGVSLRTAWPTDAGALLHAMISPT